MPDAIIIAVISTVSAVLVALIGQNYFRRKPEPCLPDPESERLIKMLEGLVEVQDIKINHLQEAVDDGLEQIKNLQTQIKELREVIVSQAKMIQDLTK